MGHVAQGDLPRWYLSMCMDRGEDPVREVFALVVCLEYLRTKRTSHPHPKRGPGRNDDHFLGLLDTSLGKPRFLGSG